LVPWCLGASRWRNLQPSDGDRETSLSLLEHQRCRHRQGPIHIQVCKRCQIRHQETASVAACESPTSHKIRRHEPREVFERLSSVPLPVAPGVAAAVSERIRLLLPLLRVAHEQRTSCSTQLAKLFVQEREPHGDESPDTGHSDAAIVLSFPGIGIHNGAAMLAEAHVALQLRDYQAFHRRAGAAPVSKRTGGKHNKPKVIQRRACSQPLRNAVYHWTRTAAQCEPRARSHYVALRALGHSHGARASWYRRPPDQIADGGS
jgi:transposase